jgi:general secretion pathway protein H
MLELMVVLVIGVLVMALVPPLISGLSGSAELQGAARRLAAGLRSARNEAVTQQRTASLRLDLERRRFTVTGSRRAYALPAGADIKLYTAQSELQDATTGGIRFFPDGSSTGGHIALRNQRVGYRVNVDWLTGRVTIVDQDVR